MAAARPAQAGSALSPDPDRIGGIAWIRRTKGRLTGRERRRLLGAIASMQAANTIGRVRLALGRLPAGADDIDVRDFEPPDSKLAREAEAACAEQPELLVGHSYRTWMWGLTLAALDGSRVDPEVFYCAALLHDFGSTTVVADEDFTLRSALRATECAEAAGLDSASAESMADGICCHPTPGVTVRRDGPIAYYIQYGAMVDGAGLRAWDIAPRNIDEVLRRYPRGEGFKQWLTGVVKAEARAVPDGRFALSVRCGMTLAVRMAPFER